MSDCLTNLKNKYPSLCEDLHYLEIHDGWFPLIEELSEEIYQHSLTLDNKEEIKVVEIKQKFGWLRFLVYNGDDVIYNMIRKAQTKSTSICEYCGEFSSGPKSFNYWTLTLCDAHKEEHQKRIEAMNLAILELQQHAKNMQGAT